MYIVYKNKKTSDYVVYNVNYRMIIIHLYTKAQTNSGFRYSNIRLVL